MATAKKKKAFSLQGFDLTAYKQTEAYVKAVETIYNKAIEDFARLASRLKINTDKPFSFSDYPSAKAEVDRILKELTSNVKGVIDEGNKQQWLFANKKNDEFLASIMDTAKLSKRTLSKFQDHNLKALAAFQKRKIDGLNLSDRVWRNAKRFKAQIEHSTDVSIGKGESAAVFPSHDPAVLKAFLYAER